MIASVLTGCQTLTGRSARQHIDDKWITDETKGRLAAADLRNLTAVNVDVNRGTIYLMGNVKSPEMKARAERIAWDVDGVRDVVNHLQVETTATAGVPASPAPTTGAAATPPSSSAPSHATTVSPAASPTSATIHQHTVTGQVANVDHNTGRLTLRNGNGDLVLQFPRAALQNVKQGDRVTVQLVLSPAR